MAAFQDSRTALYATASTATDAQVYLEALEKGTDGVVLQTDDISEVFALKVRDSWLIEGAVKLSDAIYCHGRNLYWLQLLSMFRICLRCDLS